MNPVGGWMQFEQSLQTPGVQTQAPLREPPRAERQSECQQQACRQDAPDDDERPLAQGFS